jgi:hypothetical protein
MKQYYKVYARDTKHGTHKGNKWAGISDYVIDTMKNNEIKVTINNAHVVRKLLRQTGSI